MQKGKTNYKIINAISNNCKMITFKDWVVSKTPNSNIIETYYPNKYNGIRHIDDYSIYYDTENNDIDIMTEDSGINSMVNYIVKNKNVLYDKKYQEIIDNSEIYVSPTTTEMKIVTYDKYTNRYHASYLFKNILDYVIEHDMYYIYDNSKEQHIPLLNPSSKIWFYNFFIANSI
jgi:hypothetical protein